MRPTTTPSGSAKQSEIAKRLADIERQLARIPSVFPDKQTRRFTARLHSVGHSLAFGDPVTADGYKVSDPSQQVYGVVWRVLGPDDVLVVTAGHMDGFTGLTAGRPLIVESLAYGAKTFAQVISETEVIVGIDTTNPGTVTNTEVVSVITSGDVLAMLTCVRMLPAGGFALSQADTQAHAVVHCVIGEAIGGLQYLGYESGRIRLEGVDSSSPLVTTPGRFYLDETTPGAWTATAPEIAVPVFDVVSVSGPSESGTYTVTVRVLSSMATAAEGILPLSRGGTGADLSGQPNHAVIFKYDDDKLGSVINAGGLLGVLTQTASGLPVFKSLDDTGFEDTATGIRPLICGEPILDDAPAEGAFLRLVDGEWRGFKPWVYEGELAVVGASGDIVNIPAPTNDGDVLTANLTADGLMEWLPPSGGGLPLVNGNGTATTITGSTWSGGDRLILVGVAGGGGGGGGGSSSAGVIQNSTTAVYCGGGGGATGAVVWFPIVMKNGYAFAVTNGSAGSGGAADTNGTSGGSTTLIIYDDEGDPIVSVTVPGGAYGRAAGALYPGTGGAASAGGLPGANGYMSLTANTGYANQANILSAPSSVGAGGRGGTQGFTGSAGGAGGAWYY